jgi:GNAT superfamily N-acetyltransferase
MSQPHIRRAVPADAEVLADLGRRTFSDKFAHLYPPDDLADYLRTAYSPADIAGDCADPAKALWLAEADGEPIGYAYVGPCTLPHPQVTPDCGELKRIYVLQSHQGGGLGSRLLALSLGWLEAAGAPHLWLGVYSGNLEAQRLYARHGFEKVGEYDFPVGKTLDREFILRRASAGPA